MVSFVLGGCALNIPTSPPTSGTALPAATAELAPPLPDATFSPFPWSDENAIVSGICFESAFDAAGRLFVLKNEADLIAFYDLADNSRLCRRPVARAAFDFSGERVLIGLWSTGRGCTARHDIMDVIQDDAARTFTLALRWVTEGDCNYELVRPFWIGLRGMRDYQINVTVE